MIVSTTKSSFSIWWIQLIVFIFLFDTLESIFELLLSIKNSCEISLPVLKGIACISGTCVSLGYLIFNLFFYITYKKSFQHELYIANFYPEINFFIFVIGDLVIHIFLSILTYHLWKSHALTNEHSIYGAFIFHRIWSLYASDFKTIYCLQLKPIYQYFTLVHPIFFKMVYLIEFLILTFFFLHVHCS